MDIFLPVLLALIAADTLREVYNVLWSYYYSRKWDKNRKDAQD